MRRLVLFVVLTGLVLQLGLPPIAPPCCNEGEVFPVSRHSSPCCDGGRAECCKEPEPAPTASASALIILTAPAWIILHVLPVEAPPAILQTCRSDVTERIAAGSISPPVHTLPQLSTLRV